MDKLQDNINALIQIDGLDGDKAQALGNVITQSIQNKNGSTKRSTIENLYMLIVTVVIGVGFVGMLWLFSSYSSLGERIARIEEGQKNIAKTLEDISNKLEKLPKKPE